MKIRLLLSFFSMMLVFGINAQITTVGLIGTATPNGWDSDVDMVQDVDSAHLWTLTIDLVDGEAKFRANDAWDVNWGDDQFPAGIGTQGGPNIPVNGGTYNITFNSNTGEYYFEPVSDIGIIGSATPGGWDYDVNLIQDQTDTNKYFLTLDLIAGEAKFRANDAWDVNWGSADFPSGVGVQNGPNIPIPSPGTYTVTFDKSTGAYTFDALAVITTVGIIGDATPGGNTETPLLQINPDDPNVWGTFVTLTDGGVQFSINGGQEIWGGPDFPIGIATENGGSVPVTAGNYVVVIDVSTGQYAFFIYDTYETVGLIGSATPGGWDTDTDMERSAVDSSLWTLRIELTDGEAKFRANDDWAVNWGGGDFPTGIALRDGPNIPVTAGEYIITFNSITGEYDFREIVVYDRIGLVGAGTPLASWDVDFFLTQDPTDENLWYYNSIDLNGDVKFRADSNWTVNWGSTDFPTGIGTQDGPNIPAAPGTYGIVFNSATGEYSFQDPLSTLDILDPSSVTVYPNPVSDNLQIDLTATDIRGDIKLNVFDINGKLVRSEAHNTNGTVEMSVSSLQSGYYTLHISNEKYIIGKKFVVIK